MKIAELLEDLKVPCENRIASFPLEGRMIRTMYAAIENTIFASEVDEEERMGAFIQLLMVCSQAKAKKEWLLHFSDSIIAADYYFSVMKAQKAVPFLNKALELMAEVLGEEKPLFIEDADAFINEFRATNLREQQYRMNHAVNHIYIFNGTALKLGLDVAFPEVLKHDVPLFWHFKTFVVTLVMALVSGTLLGIPLTESMSPWRAANEAGTPISIFDAWHPMNQSMLCAGVLMLLLTITYVAWLGTNSYIRIMSKWAYWKFCR